MSTINTSSLSDHLPPSPTADYLHSMKTSEPKAQQVGLPPEKVPVRNWALSVELVGLMYSRGRATRGSASVELGFGAELVGLPPEKVPVRNWALSVELVGLMYSRGRATRGSASVELGFGAELVGLMQSRRRATRGGASAELGLGAELVGLMCSGGVATREGASAELGFKCRAGRAYALVWSGEVANRLIQAREEITKTKHSMDEHLVEIRANNDKEKEEENKALQAEVDKWRGEAENSWELGKEKFLQSKEFRVLCSGKALAFFEKGFEGCLAQFRESGYIEEERPAPFLDVERALAALLDDEDAEERGVRRLEDPDAISLSSSGDDMWFVIPDGPIKIMRPNTALAITSGAAQWVVKPRMEWTSEDKKNANLDNVAKDILYKTLENSVALLLFVEGKRQRFDNLARRGLDVATGCPVARDFLATVACSWWWLL
ncbi:hypothetical protein F511_18469 [Dorcoceras hygrometricum]|uniref:Uncharacterized protein n=1 Tax=Dorcoceras hygrometricum TaxID=472368 RepID=A0A2Z7CCA8_9LAMI|nr:hypothetical protein F511_18469 [Dorcoceras hygrometricum]